MGEVKTGVFLNMQYFSLNNKADWEKGIGQNIRVTDGLRIEQVAGYVFRQTKPIAGVGSSQFIQDACTGEKGFLYFLDNETNVWRFSCDSAYTELWLEKGHRMFSQHASIASLDDYVVIADPTHERKIAAYHVQTGQMLWAHTEFNGQPLFPLAIYMDKRGVLYVLCPLDSNWLEQTGDEPAEVRLGILKYTIHGEYRGLIEHERFVVSLRSGARDLFRRFRLARAEGELLITLDTATNTLMFLSDGLFTSETLSVPNARLFGLALDQHGNLYMGDVLTSHGEENRNLYQYRIDQKTLLPMGSFRRNAQHLLIDDLQRLVLVDGIGHQVYLYEQNPLTKRRVDQPAYQGTYFSHSLDSTVEETVWHRIAVHADIPDDTSIEISYFTSDSKKMWVSDEYVDLDEYLRRHAHQPELVEQALEHIWSKPIINPKDALLHNAKGRYIWFRIRLNGSERNTPVLKGMRIYFPRETLLRFLPAVYQEDKRSSDFLERFLSLFGSFFQEMDERISQLPRLFDVQVADHSFLRWIGMWLGIADEEQWSEVQLRRLILNAPQLYREKGTRRGIERLVELYTGEKPFILEYFQVKQWRDVEGLREWVDELFGENPYSFCVMVRDHVIRTNEQHHRIQRLIEEMKPSLTEAKLVILQPWIYLGFPSFLGVNTFLSEPTSFILDNRSAVPYHTMLVDERKNRMDIHTRLGVDAELIK